MNFRDTFVTCEECGKQFVFTVEKQRQMSEQGLEITPPTRCKDCVPRIDYGDKFHGSIKWFNLEKGYGFIAEDGGNEIFVHRNSVVLTEDGTMPQLDEGQEVLYERSDTPKGPQAVQVTPYYG